MINRSTTIRVVLHGDLYALDRLSCPVAHDAVGRLWRPCRPHHNTYRKSARQGPQYLIGMVMAPKSFTNLPGMKIPPILFVQLFYPIFTNMQPIPSLW